jgi:hypothetical protein
MRARYRPGSFQTRMYTEKVLVELGKATPGFKRTRLVREVLQIGPQEHRSDYG